MSGAQMETATCTVCNSEFTFKRWGGRPRRACSDKCRKQDKAARDRARYMKNPEATAERNEVWRKANPEKARKARQAYVQSRAARDPDYAILVALGTQMANMLRRTVGKKGVGAAKDAADRLGYTAADLKRHIESRFTDGMNWDNRDQWHIDHIIPHSVMRRRGETDPAIIDALDNLQPMWADENRAKAARFHDWMDQ